MTGHLGGAFFTRRQRTKKAATYAWDNASAPQGITTTNVPTSFSPTTLGNVSYTYDPAGHVITRGCTLFQSIQADAITAAGATITPSLDGHGNLVGASAIADLRV